LGVGEDKRGKETEAGDASASSMQAATWRSRSKHKRYSQALVAPAPEHRADRCGRIGDLGREAASSVPWLMPRSR